MLPKRPCVRNRTLRMYVRRQRRAFKLDADPVCVVCLDGFDADELFPLVLACDHVLHHTCYAAWHTQQTEWLREDGSRPAVTMTLDAFGVPCPMCRCAAPAL